MNSKKKKFDIPYTETKFGFVYGSANVERLISDDLNGSVVLAVKTPKYKNGVQLYVTRTGKVRIYSDGIEWILPKKPKDLKMSKSASIIKRLTDAMVNNTIVYVPSPGSNRMVQAKVLSVGKIETRVAYTQKKILGIFDNSKFEFKKH